MAKKVKDSLVNSSDIKLKQDKKQPKPKAAKVDQLHPKADNHSSLTENIQSRSSQSVGDSVLGKISKVPMNQHLDITPKKKK